MKVLFIIPGDINLPTGGYRYDKQILEAWEEGNKDVTLVAIKGEYPLPSQTDITHALDEIEHLSDADVAVVDGLMGGAAPQFLQALAQKMTVVALIHHPLCLENGLDEKQASKLEVLERQGLEHVSQIITSSPTTSKTVCELFGYNPNKIHAVLPGVERGEISKGSGTDRINLLCVGSIIERKGHKDLLEALADLKQLNWQLDCIGSTDFNPELYVELEDMIKTKGLADKVTFHGEVSENKIIEAYSKADVFVLPSLYEGYGMAYAEAIVRGIPVIGTTAGAIPQTVPQTCGILVEPNNPQALSTALKRMIGDSDLRLQYQKSTLIAEPTFPTWQGSADKFYQILENIS